MNYQPTLREKTTGRVTDSVHPPNNTHNKADSIVNWTTPLDYPYIFIYKHYGWNLYSVVIAKADVPRRTGAFILGAGEGRDRGGGG